MKGRKPGTSRFRRAFLVAAAAIGITAGGAGLDNLPKDPVLDTHITFQAGTPEQYGYNISPVDQMWKHTLGMKSAAQRDIDLIAAARAGDSWRVRVLATQGIDAEAAGAQALVAAAGAGHADVVDALMKAGVKADAQNGAAFRAAREGHHAAAVDILLSQTRTVAVFAPGPRDPYSIWTGGKPYDDAFGPHRFGPPPFFDSYSDPFDMRFTLVTQPVIDVNANSGQALYDAVYNNDLAMARVLVRHGADAGARGGKIRQLANESRNTAMVDLLNGRTFPSFGAPPPAP
jgi:hypothetical protein